MLTQKQALKNLLELIESNPCRYLLISNWLEDINWHTENKMFWSEVPQYAREYLAGINEKHPLYRDWKSAENDYRVFNKIFGWGVDRDGWNSTGIGKEFVDELLDLVKEVEQEK